jgi:hypothetical protein
VDDDEWRRLASALGSAATARAYADTLRRLVATLPTDSMRAFVQAADRLIAPAREATARLHSPTLLNASLLRLAQHMEDTQAALRHGIGEGALRAIAQYQQAWGAQMARATEALQTWRPVISAVVTEQLNALVEARSVLHWMLATELASRGWWLVPSWPASLLAELWDVTAERRGRRVVDTHLLGYYRARRHLRLGRTVRAWTEPEFAARMVVFREALTDYRARRFRRAIAALTPQIEGVVKDFLLKEGLITPRDARRDGTATLVAAHVAEGHRHAALPGAMRRLRDLYSEFTWGVVSSGRQVSRHPLTHGAVVPPNSEVEALQLFLMLDTLHFFLADLRRRRAVPAA